MVKSKLFIRFLAEKLLLFATQKNNHPLGRLFCQILFFACKHGAGGVSRGNISPLFKGNVCSSPADGELKHTATLVSVVLQRLKSNRTPALVQARRRGAISFFYTLRARHTSVSTCFV